MIDLSPESERKIKAIHNWVEWIRDGLLEGEEDIGYYWLYYYKMGDNVKKNVSNIHDVDAHVQEFYDHIQSVVYEKIEGLIEKHEWK